jgi:hypothetical protein
LRFRQYLYLCFPVFLAVAFWFLLVKQTEVRHRDADQSSHKEVVTGSFKTLDTSSAEEVFEPNSWDLGSTEVLGQLQKSDQTRQRSRTVSGRVLSRAAAAGSRWTRNPKTHISGPQRHFEFMVSGY